MKRQSSSYYIDGILNKDRVILSQAITLVESAKKEDQEIAQQIINSLTPNSGGSIRIGITGVPGVGKSTFIEAFGNYLTSSGKKIAVLAIDPTSQSSRGSILGDKTRMENLSINPNAYIRPSASGKNLGGIAQKTKETIILCEAAGYDVILVETVGVGQSEIEVDQLTDFFLLLMIPGAGDELQGIKRGIMEMADAIIINKAEKSNLTKAKIAQKQYKNALHLFPPKESGWTPTVSLCSAIENKGISEVWETIQSYHNFTRLNGFLDSHRTNQNEYWFEKRLKEEVLHKFFESNSKNINALKKRVRNGELSPFLAVTKVLKDQ